MNATCCALLIGSSPLVKNIIAPQRRKLSIVKTVTFSDAVISKPAVAPIRWRKSCEAGMTSWR